MKKVVTITVLVIILAAVGLYGLVYWTPRAPSPIPGDGVRFGFIRSVGEKDGRRVIQFDDAQWYIGEEAKEAAIMAGTCTRERRDECAPNDYFILNEDKSTTEIPLAEGPTIAMMTLNSEKEGVKETQIEPDAFAKLINDKSKHWKDLPYQLMVEQGVVTIIEETYVP